jgi:hypothetical protein
MLVFIREIDIRESIGDTLHNLIVGYDFMNATETGEMTNNTDKRQIMNKFESFVQVRID